MAQTNDIASRVTEIRKVLKLKQKDFAARLGISGPSISEIEKGKYKPNFDFLYNASREFNVNLYYLLFGEGEMFLDPTSSITSRADDFPMDNEDVRTFFHYFKRSRAVQYSILAYFRGLLLRDKDTIANDLKAYENKGETP